MAKTTIDDQERGQRVNAIIPHLVGITWEEACDLLASCMATSLARNEVRGHEAERIMLKLSSVALENSARVGDIVGARNGR